MLNSEPTGTHNFYQENHYFLFSQFLYVALQVSDLLRGKRSWTCTFTFYFCHPFLFVIGAGDTTGTCWTNQDKWWLFTNKWQRVLTCLGDKSPWMPSVVLKGVSAIYSYSKCILCFWEVFKIISIRLLCYESIKHQRGHCPEYFLPFSTRSVILWNNKWGWLPCREMKGMF